MTFTAFLGATNATGTMAFYDGPTTIGTSAVSKAQATFATAGLSIGSHLITATYGGDSSYGGSTSNVLTQWVGMGPVNITLTSTPNPSIRGQMVTFTVCGLPSDGTLQFLDGTVPLGTNNSLYGPCSPYSTNVLSVGMHSITARYNGGGTISGLATLTQTVNAY